MGQRWKRQVLLFLFAIVVPAAVLVTLTVRLVRQEAELGIKRVETARRDAIEQLRRELTARLDVIKASFDTLPPSNPAIVFVAPLEQDRMVLPWESSSSPRPSAPFMSLQNEGDSHEFRLDDPATAYLFYRR